MYRYLLILLSSFIATGLTAQKVSGIWKGKLTQGPGGCFPFYNIELQIHISGTKVQGASYHYSDITHYVKEEFTGSYNPESNSLQLNEMKILTFKVPGDCIPCIKQYSLVYTKNDQNETLNGDWGGVTMNNQAACPPGRIVLSRATESDFAHIQEIKVDTGIIRLDFYDNAQIDGDSITILLNNQVIASHQLLTAKPTTIEIRVDLINREQELEMVAENLGSIPPNTALLIVTAGTKRYRLYLSSIEKRNAMVRFVYEKQD